MNNKWGFSSYYKASKSNYHVYGNSITAIIIMRVNCVAHGFLDCVLELEWSLVRGNILHISSPKAF